MFNDSNGIKDAESYINGFPLIPNNELPAFLISNNLSFTLEQIIFIRDYYRNEKKAFPTYNQIMFFDTINKIRKSQKKEYCIYSANADEDAKAIMQSSKDLLSKTKTLKRTYAGAMPLTFASEIASNYLRLIGYAEKTSCFIPAETATSYDFYIHTNNNIPLFVYSNDLSAESKHSNSNSLHNTLVMLCPPNGSYDSEYSSKVSELLAIPEINDILSNRTTVNGEYGLLDILMKETNGAFVNLSSIPQIEKDENGKVLYLTSLISNCIGKHVFSTNNASVGIINRIAEQYSLQAFIFATKNNSGMLTLESTKNPAFSFSFSFLKNIMSFKEHREYVLSTETNVPIGKKENVYITDNRNIPFQTHSAEKILNFGKVIATASSRELSFSPHKSAAITIIDSINALIAKGVSKNSITLSIHYSLLCGTDDGRELGRNLSSILGAYRSMVELCVADVKPQISYNTNKRSITVLASSKPPKKQIKSAFSNENSHIYFYNQPFTEDGIPDYQKYRDFLQYFYSLAEDDNILSANAVNENFLSVLQNASQDSTINNINFEMELNDFSLGEAHGILFQTREMIAITSDIIYIGYT